VGQRGPAPTPTRILALRGSNRAGRSSPGEPAPEVALAPAPEWISEDAKKTYAAVGERLVALGVVTVLDGEALALFAMAWARLRRCEEFLQKHGEVYAVAGKKDGPPVGFRLYPQAKLALELSDRVMRLSDRLGLSPAARARLCAETPVGDDAPEATTFDYFGPASGTG
jgi:P27 family predicted phage terminase small subunit